MADRGGPQNGASNRRDEGPPNDESSAGGEYIAYNGPPLAYQPEPEEIVQVVYQSNHNGALVGIESSLIQYGDQHLVELGGHPESAAHLSRAASTLPSVAEESSSGAGVGSQNENSTGANHHNQQQLQQQQQNILNDDSTSRSISRQNDNDQTNDFSADQNQPIPLDGSQLGQVDANQDDTNAPSYDSLGDYPAEQRQQQQYYANQQLVDPNAIYSTVSRPIRTQSTTKTFGVIGGQQTGTDQGIVYDSSQQVAEQQPSSASYSNLFATNDQTASLAQTDSSNLNQVSQIGLTKQPDEIDGEPIRSNEKENLMSADEDANEGEISNILRLKQGAAESGSFKNNFRKKLGISVSTNEHDLIVHRQKLLESQGSNIGANLATTAPTTDDHQTPEEDELASLPKFKRTHSVSFNVGSSRASRHSVDIRNLPSYLTVKRASIVDVARGAMSSLMHSFGSSAGSNAGSQRRDSSPDEEPIFEEPIAPTLSLGQRVALVKASGAEFGTVGWIGQLPDVDDDWIVGVIFDNMIGNCDGAHNGVRYFYARDNYAMFVPLSVLTKTDNYIGRPETGTMLSRMSVSLKPGQLISIQRSSIRLQHCFLNAPHQRVGHDVRAVSNRLHCQCHNCGPCAHLTKQGRTSGIPPFGAHHAPNKKNSLAHAAVEILAHHHHHYHEEEHKEEDYQFGDNAAHACNYVRYSCCQQTSAQSHHISADCGMVRPELLDNLIHAPRAPHRRSRPARQAALRQAQRQQQLAAIQCGSKPPPGAIGDSAPLQAIEGAEPITDGAALKAWQAGEINASPDELLSNGGYNQDNDSGSAYTSCPTSSRSSSPGSAGDEINPLTNYPPASITDYQYDSSTLHRTGYGTLDTQMSILDQQRFIYRRESRPSTRSSDYGYADTSGGGLGSSIRRCFACIVGRRNQQRDRRPKKKKRKMSARNRMIEYRRKQSTFVPSTLAKPHEDFASHGIIMPSSAYPSQANPQSDQNSDYSSYSRSSGCSSRSNSPVDNHQHFSGQQFIADGEIVTAQAATGATLQSTNAGQVGEPDFQQTVAMEHAVPNPNGQLKSSCMINTIESQVQQLNYDDYTFSDRSYKKSGYSRESALTDLGYYDSWATSYSNDTLKHIIDQTINEQEALPEIDNDQMVFISPILSTNGDQQSDLIDISSPTASIGADQIVDEQRGLSAATDRHDDDHHDSNDEDVCHRMGCLDLDEGEDA